MEGVCRKEQQKPDHIHLFTHPFTNSFILSGLGQRGKWLPESQGLEELKGCNQETGEGAEEQRAQWETRGKLSGAASGNSLDSGEWAEGQPLLESCREAVASAESQGRGRQELKRNSLKILDL